MELLRRAGRICRECMWFALLIGALVPFAQAQVAPAAYSGFDSFWVGAEYSNINASFPYQSGSRLAGVGVFADVNFGAHLGIEADARFMNFGGFESETERTLLAGPRFRFRAGSKLQPFAQGLFGVATIHYPFDIGQANYLAVAPAGGVSYRMSHRWLLRAQYEYQFWLNSPGYVNEPAHALTPSGLQVGFAFRPFR